MATNAMATTTSKAFLRSVAPQPPLADAPGDSARPMLSSPAATERSSVTATDAFGLSLRKKRPGRIKPRREKPTAPEREIIASTAGMSTQAIAISATTTPRAAERILFRPALVQMLEAYVEEKLSRLRARQLSTKPTLASDLSEGATSSNLDSTLTSSEEHANTSTPVVSDSDQSDDEVPKREKEVTFVGAEAV